MSKLFSRSKESCSELAEPFREIGRSEKPLALLTTGAAGTISRLDGEEDFRCKMMSLGILPGQKIVVARGEKHQPYILRVGESRVMIDWPTLSRIFIQAGFDSKRKEGSL